MSHIGSLLAGERSALLAAATDAVAQQHVLFDRDETDSYRVRLEAVDAARRQLTRTELMPALPVGSRWRNALGWESYLLFPAPHTPGQSSVTVVGLEYVLEHETRGAYAAFAGAVVPTELVHRVANAIADQLDPGNSAIVGPTYGVVISDATSLKQHRRAAAWILRAGGASYAEGSPRTVRTVLLTEDEVPSKRTLMSGGRRYLVGVVPPLRNHFARSSNTLLGLLRRKSFPRAS